MQDAFEGSAEFVPFAEQVHPDPFEVGGCVIVHMPLFVHHGIDRLDDRLFVAGIGDDGDKGRPGFLTFDIEPTEDLSKGVSKSADLNEIFSLQNCSWYPQELELLSDVQDRVVRKGLTRLDQLLIGLCLRELEFDNIAPGMDAQRFSLGGSVGRTGMCGQQGRHLVEFQLHAGGFREDLHV